MLDTLLATSDKWVLSLSNDGTIQSSYLGVERERLDQMSSIDQSQELIVANCSRALSEVSRVVESLRTDRNRLAKEKKLLVKEFEEEKKEMNRTIEELKQEVQRLREENGESMAQQEEAFGGNSHLDTEDSLASWVVTETNSNFNNDSSNAKVPRQEGKGTMAMEVFQFTWEGTVKTCSLQKKLSQCAKGIEETRKKLSLHRTHTLASTEADFDSVMNKVSRRLSLKERQDSLVRINVNCAWGLAPPNLDASRAQKGVGDKEGSIATHQPPVVVGRPKDEQSKGRLGRSNFHDGGEVEERLLTKFEIEEIQSVAESTHPYNRSIDGYYHVIARGVSRRRNGTDFKKNLDEEEVTGSGGQTTTTQFCEIVFDPRCCTAGPSDFIRIYKDQSCSAVWGEKKYFGGPSEGNWPGLNGRPPLVIPATKFVVYFHTEATNMGDKEQRNRWGFRLLARGCDSRLYVGAIKRRSDEMRSSAR